MSEQRLRILFGDEAARACEARHAYHVVFTVSDGKRPTQTFGIFSATVTVPAPINDPAVLGEVHRALVQQNNAAHLVIVNWKKLRAAR